jgi:hypothetical protein
MRRQGYRKRSCWLSVALVISFLGTAFACQVPVFRYAMERWAADPYEILVLVKGTLSDDDQAAIDLLRRTSEGQDKPPFSVKLVNVEATADQELVELWRQRSSQADCLLVVLYPRRAQVASRLAYVGPFGLEAVRRVIDSPARKAVLGDLQKGASAVWLFMPCGDSEKDELAYQALKEQLATDSDWASLPSAEEMEISPEVMRQVKIGLRIDFSIVRIDPKDPNEQFLVDSLLNSESDLREFNEPMAFPIFGRGRVLYALIGKGIAPETIRSATAFITGPCSCQVKDQNPGFDLLMPSDWEQALGEVLISEPIPAAAQQPRLLTIPPGRKK